MSANDLEFSSAPVQSTLGSDEEFSTPLNISDLIIVCKEYAQLGYQIQNQIENILEDGVEEAIKSGSVKREALPHIKSFLKAIHSNFYFGDASSSAENCIELIEQYEESHKINKLVLN